MSACACGNEIGKPRVSPYPVTITDVQTGQALPLLYMAGMDQTGKCWFCAFPRKASK